jgi:hypothetical protein
VYHLEEGAGVGSTTIELTILPGRLAVCRLAPEAAAPPWGMGGALWSLTRSGDELSVVCAEELVPEGVRREGGWRALAVAGPLDFALTGVLSAIAAPLAAAGVSIFALSTFDTDYVLVKEERLEAAVAALRAAGMGVA